MDREGARGHSSPHHGRESPSPFAHLRMPGFRGKGIRYALAAAAFLWLASGLYTVGPDEKGVVLRFGRVSAITDSGLNYHLPYPFETVYTPKVTEAKRVEIGFRTVDAGPPARYADRPGEALMLTGDENIVDIDVIVQYLIADPMKYLFAVRNPDRTVRHAAEAALREVIGRKDIDEALTTGKPEIQAETQALLQRLMDGYETGLRIVAVQLQDVDPPKEVRDAFIDVASAREDRNRLINEAEGYRNSVIPEARGRVSEILNRAEAYREEKVRRAKGDADRFRQILKEYEKVKDVTRKRLYLETMEEILPGMRKVILDEAESGALPVPPLDGDAGTPSESPRE